jgi:hypothetical protein
MSKRDEGDGERIPARQLVRLAGFELSDEIYGRLRIGVSALLPH